MHKILSLFVLFSCIITIFAGCSAKQPADLADSTNRRVKMPDKTSLFYKESGTDKVLEVSQMEGWDIVVGPEAIPSEKYAAEEFQSFFQEATGISLTINNNADSAKKHVYIAHKDVDVSELGEEGFKIIVDEDSLFIAGGKPRGTLYGVYQFLEDAMGIRFLTCDHTHIPHDARMSAVPYGEYSYMPPFSFRWSYYRENSERPDFAAKLRINTVTGDEKLGGKTQQNLINHSFGWLLPFSKYGEEHPEYYAMWEGKRDTHTGGGGPQLCVSNEEVIKLVAENAIKHLDAHPGLKNISVSQADTARYCHCEECEKINQREGTPMGSNLAFVNAVAEIIEKKYPDVKVGTLAYWYTRQAPKTIKPRHNVQIQLCSIECCTFNPIDDPECERNTKFCQDMNEWSAICNDIWVWNYNTNFRYYDLPFPNLRSIGPNVRYFLKSNVKGLFMQANGNGTSGEFSDLRNYLISRMIWNPRLDDQEVLKEFVTLHYKSAAQPIMDYINMFHDNVAERGLHPGCFPKPEEVGLDPDVCREIMAYFNKALEMADDEVVRSRVEKASICAYRAMIEAGGLEGSERDQVIDKYIELAKKHNLTMAAEHMSAEDFFAKLKAEE
ncbi:DUF4838 domain-containing protein [Candidatus Poribacteria bacterium]|nr:DUF4838 domain-containing protein [Candidatus Poribacteria bacterium]